MPPGSRPSTKTGTHRKSGVSDGPWNAIGVRARDGNNRATSGVSSEQPERWSDEMVPMIGEPYLDAGEPWSERAACASYPTDMFFPSIDVPDAGRAAKEVCSICPVREECLSFAIDTSQAEGIWGGMDAGERRRYRRRIRDRARRMAS